MSEHLLSVQDLHTSFFTDSGEVHAVNGVSFNLDPGEVLGIVGESGSGKSVTAYSIMQILADTGRITQGSIRYKGDDITKWTERQMSAFRGKCCSIVFQDPMTSLNPVFTVGSQLREAIELHTDKRGAAAKARAIEMLELVGINENDFDAESDTVGGWTLEMFGSFPAEGDSFRWEQLTVTVLKMDGLRVERVLVRREEQPAEDGKDK